MVFQRFSRAVQAFRGQPPRPSGRKVAPYAFPVFVNGQAHWQIDDFSAYVREGYDLNSVIYSAVSYKARTIAKARLRAYRGDPENPERVEATHPLAMLTARPNPFQSWLEFQQQRETYLNLSGNSYTWLDRPKRDAMPTAMYNLRPDRVWIVPGTRDIKGFFYVPEGGTRESGMPFLPQDVEHVKFPNPKDPLEGLGYGLSPMSSLAQSADVDNIVTAYIKLLFEQGGVPSGIIKTKVPLDQNGITRIKERWREQYGGFRNWADIGVLDTESEYQRLGMTFKELGFDTLDARNESRMLGPFGVPPMLIFTRYGMERGTFNNYEQAREACWEDTLLPELELFQADDEYSLHGDDGTFVRYDISEIPALQKKVTPLVDAAYKLWTMGTPRNQALAAVGLRMADAPGGDTAYVPASFIAAGSTAPAPTPAGDNTVSATDDNRDGAAAPPKVARSRKSASHWSDEDKARLWKAADSLAVGHEDAFRAEAQTQFHLDEREVLALVSTMKRKSLQRKASIQWELMLDDVHDVLTAAGARWREAFTPLVKGVVVDTADHWQVQAGLSFDVTRLEDQQFFIDHMATFADPITATSEREIAAMLQLATKEGWSVPQMQTGLTTMFQQWISGNINPDDWTFVDLRLPPWRTEMIGRTETMKAANWGSTEVYRANGVESRTWISTMDDRTRDAHAEADGQIAEINESFSVGGEELMYPGDPNGSPENIISCRCTTIPNLE